MYTLRSGASYNKAVETPVELTQTTIPFRKRRRPAVEGLKPQEKLGAQEDPAKVSSPPKKTKQESK